MRQTEHNRENTNKRMTHTNKEEEESERNANKHKRKFCVGGRVQPATQPASHVVSGSTTGGYVDIGVRQKLCVV